MKQNNNRNIHSRSGYCFSVVALFSLTLWSCTKKKKKKHAWSTKRHTQKNCTTLPIKDLSSNKLTPQGKVHISSREEGQSWSPKDMPFPLPPWVSRARGGRCLPVSQSLSDQAGVGSFFFLLLLLILELSQSRWFKPTQSRNLTEQAWLLVSPVPASHSSPPQ